MTKLKYFCVALFVASTASGAVQAGGLAPIVAEPVIILDDAVAEPSIHVAIPAALLLAFVALSASSTTN